MSAAPKHKRVVDPRFPSQVRRRDGRCLAGPFLKDPCAGALHAHHIHTRGSGGDDLLENGILLCAKHHDLAHRHFIASKFLRHILMQLYGYAYG